MKATGIVRHIDELGRLVIPKEIRKNMRIREGDPLEIYTDEEGTIVLKKHSPMGELKTFAKQLAELLGQSTGHPIAISDREQLVAVAGGMPKDLVGKKISKELDQLISERESINTLKKGKVIPIVEGQKEIGPHQIIYPILGDGEILGSVIMIQNNETSVMAETEQKLVMVAAGFLGKQMES